MIFVRWFMVFELDVLAEGRDVQSVFVSCVSFGFRDGLRSTYDFFDIRAMFFFVLVGFFVLGELFFLFSLDVVFFERSPCGDAVRLRFFADFILFCVD